MEMATEVPAGEQAGNEPVPETSESRSRRRRRGGRRARARRAAQGSGEENATEVSDTSIAEPDEDASFAEEEGGAEATSSSDDHEPRHLASRVEREPLHQLRYPGAIPAPDDWHLLMVENTGPGQQPGAATEPALEEQVSLPFGTD
jgi:ribonuclease E